MKLKCPDSDGHRAKGKASVDAVGIPRLSVAPECAESSSLGVQSLPACVAQDPSRRRIPPRPGVDHQPATNATSTATCPEGSVNGTEAADWSACGRACFLGVSLWFTFLACLWEGLQFHNKPLHLPTRGHLRSPKVSKSHPMWSLDRSKTSQEQNPHEAAHSAV